MKFSSCCLFLALCTLACPSGADAHPPGPDEHHDDAPTQDAWPAARLTLPSLDGPVPWSDKPLLSDPDRFHIAIMTDRTGGHRPGIWLDAVRKINLMRPEFVVSVGDLIEGYTQDEIQLRREWDEFLGFIDELEMKFFFVAGNHDVSNPKMHELWRQQFGPEWYSFDYKGVHFLCLSSEDPEAELSEKQFAWIEQDLAEHADARWTLIFLHKPLWAYAEREMAAGNPDPTGWTRVEAALGDRPRTVFAGHHHSYVQFDRRGMKYYQLATTGGGSRLRGNQYGEFDHFVWLTMEEDGPRIANLRLDGILSPDVVTEESIARFNAFLAGTRLDIAPILISDEGGFDRGRIELRLTNDFDVPVEVSGRLDGVPLQGVTVEPHPLTLRAAPGETVRQSVLLEFTQKIDFARLAGTTLTANLRSEETPSLTAEIAIPVLIDQTFSVPMIATAPKIDGDLSDWDAFRFESGDKPMLLKETQLWQGPGDASFAFEVARDDQFIYFAARVRDDRVTERDRLAIRLDVRPIARRITDPDIGLGSYRFRAAPGTGISDPGYATLHEAQNRRVEVEPPSSVVRTETGYNVEFAFPTSLLKAQQGDQWHSFQMTVVVNDFDEPELDSSRVVWRGSAEVDFQNTGYGQFVPAPAAPSR